MNRKDRRASRKQSSNAAVAPAVKALFDSALRCHQSGQLADAETHYRRLIAIDPKHELALYYLGIVGIQTGRPELAIDFIGRAIKLNDRMPEWHYHLALAHHARGNLDEVISHYRRAISLDPDYAYAHTNLGNALAQQGKLTEAVSCYRQVLRLNPQAHETHYNIANLLAQQGQFMEAEEHYQRAVTLKPDFAEAHNNFGIALREQGKIDEASAQFQLAVAYRPDFLEALHNLGWALLAGRNAAQALAVAQHALAIMDTADGRELFVEAVQKGRSISDPGKLSDLLARALSEPWCRPDTLSSVASSLIFQDATVRQCMTRAMDAWPARLLAPDLFGPAGPSALSKNRLLCALLTSARVKTIGIERLLTAARSAMLESATCSTDASVAHALTFYGAMAEQCFINGYVYDATQGELANADALRDALVFALRSGQTVAALQVIAVAAYFPLHSLPSADILLERQWPDAVNRLINQQVRGPEEERNLRAAIPALTVIDNDVSRAVRQQYEEHPYPVWVTTASLAKPVSIDGHLKAKFPLAPLHPIGKEAIDVLVAGCGTGQQTVEIALQLQGFKMLAVDLSLASLAYAKRKTLALGAPNIEYAQADILCLNTVGRTFDVIIATGVLHHLADPDAGWRALLTLLRPNGLMNVGLYSEVARQDVLAAQTFAAERGFGSSAGDIRRFRQELMRQNDNPLLKRITEAADFFSINECRDLIFHIQEHRSTLPQIKRTLAQYDLEFVGFNVDLAIRREYTKRFPHDKPMVDLDLWHTFETENPRTFVDMYQFWVQKRG